MNKISFDFYNCNNDFMGGIEDMSLVFNVCSSFEKAFNVELLFKPIIVPYFYGKQPKDDGFSCYCLFKDKDNGFGFFTLHTFNKRKIAYFDMVCEKTVNAYDIKEKLTSVLKSSTVKEREPMTKGSWGIELVVECMGNDNITIDSLHDLNQKIIKKSI